MHLPKLTKWQRGLLAYASAMGIDGAHLEFGGRHPHIVGTYRGSQFRRAIASSPSDAARAQIKAECDLRRECRRLEFCEKP